MFLRISPRAWALSLFVVAGCGGTSTVPDAGGEAGAGSDLGGMDAGHDAAVPDDSGAVDMGGPRPDAHCATDADADGHIAFSCGGDDCDDADPNAYPGNAEVCDAAGHDEDCNPATLGPDGDGDGAPATTCCDVQPSGPPLCGTDCDDTRATVNASAVESCNGIDDNCNGMIDEGVTLTCFVDADGDGYASAGASSHTACVCAAGSTSMAPGPGTSDCNDSNASANPAASEVCNGIDDNCNGMTDEGVTTTVYRDFDGDGYGDATMTRGVCTLPAGYVASAGDCNDTNMTVHPGATEACNGIDDNCNGTVDEGCGCINGHTQQCGTSDGTPTGFLMVGACHPGLETCSAGMWGSCVGAVMPVMEICNGVDDNCNGTVDEGTLTACYPDADGDSFAPTGSTPMMLCACSSTQTTRVPADATSSDCDDARGSVHPGGTEVCNGLDDNCNGMTDEGVGSTFYRDLDADGYGAASSGTIVACATPPGYSTTNNDCNDACAGCHPGGTEVCDTFDNDCNGLTDENLGGPCSVGTGACVAMGQTRCSGACTATPGTPDSAWHTGTAPNGSWDWNCDGTVTGQYTVTDFTDLSATAWCRTKTCNYPPVAADSFQYAYWSTGAVGLTSPGGTTPYCGLMLWSIDGSLYPECYNTTGAAGNPCTTVYGGATTPLQGCH